MMFVNDRQAETGDVGRYAEINVRASTAHLNEIRKRGIVECRYPVESDMVRPANADQLAASRTCRIGKVAKDGQPCRGIEGRARKACLPIILIALRHAHAPPNR